MKVTAIQVPALVPTLSVETGRVYDFPQQVLFSLCADNPLTTGWLTTTWDLADASRGMYEKVQLNLPWVDVHALQDGNQSVIQRVGMALMSQYDAGKYAN